jgi:hypothetical protein
MCRSRPPHAPGAARMAGLGTLAPPQERPGDGGASRPLGGDKPVESAQPSSIHPASTYCRSRGVAGSRVSRRYPPLCPTFLPSRTWAAFVGSSPTQRLMSAMPSCFSGGNTWNPCCCTRERPAIFRRLRPSSQNRSMGYGLQASWRRYESSPGFLCVGGSKVGGGLRVCSPDLLHAIHGMPARTLLFLSVRPG